MNLGLIPGVKVNITFQNRDIHDAVRKAESRWYAGYFRMSLSDYLYLELMKGQRSNPNHRLLKAYIMASFDVIQGTVLFLYPPHKQVEGFLKLNKAMFKKAWRNFTHIYEIEKTCKYYQDAYFTPNGWEIEDSN